MIATQIKYRRMLQGLTRNELAKHSGVSQAALWKIENKNSEPLVTTAAKLAKGLDVQIEQLLKPVTREQWAKACELQKQRREAKNGQIKETERARWARSRERKRAAKLSVKD